MSQTSHRTAGPTYFRASGGLPPGSVALERFAFIIKKMFFPNFFQGQVDIGHKYQTSDAKS